jgi:DNA-directed RNA polymerase subunit RPC12/RpoP
MTGGVASGTTYDVVCPHCKKQFAATLMEGRRAAHHGFKCPHCRLFVPLERRDDADAPLARTPDAPDA